MKITRIETFEVPPRWLFCRVETDEGLVGWGEPIVEGRAEVVRAAVAVLAEYLIGQDPLSIEKHWQVMTKGGFYRGGPILSSAVSGLDQAMWDIAGKSLDAPVHQLFGGIVRERARVYSWIGGDEPTELVDAALAQVEAGFTAVKMNGSGRLSQIATVAELDAVLDRVHSVRDAVGPNVDVAVDFHGRMSMATARVVLPRLESAGLLFAEEPLLPEHMHLLPRLTESTTVPIAVGERMYSRHDFLAAIDGGAAVAQPDLSHAGGLTEVRRIASFVEPYGMWLAPHCPLGPLALASSLQLAFTSPNFLIQEQSVGLHYNAGSELFDCLLDDEPFRFHEGTVHAPTGPGLGVLIDEGFVRRADREPHRWRNPVWYHPDGSLAEW